MKIVIPCFNYLLNEELIFDGGSIYLNNLKMAFLEIGQDCELVPLDWKGKADLMIIQSEWVGRDSFRQFLGKKIVIAGHFIDSVYPDPKEIKADHFITTWIGECTECYPDAVFIPHGYNNLHPKKERKNFNKVVWCGNKYPLRDEGWLEGMDIDDVKIHPREIDSIYEGNVVGNVHGKFQLGEISNEPSRIADKLGWMINERFWTVIGAGGILIQQYHPQILTFFEEDEIIMAKTKEEFQERCKYYLEHREEGIEFYKRARKKILDNHTYVHRANKILEIL